MTVVTRFSPHGNNFQIGDARTALINYLYAKCRGGTFVLDTTHITKSPALVDGLDWLNIPYGEPGSPLQRSHEIVGRLIETEQAYRGHSGMVFLFNPEEKTELEDAVHGTVTINSGHIALTDNDGFPTDTLISVTSDIDMGVTHIIQEGNHSHKAFNEVRVYDALGLPRPIYAHLPLIYDENGNRCVTTMGEIIQRGIRPIVVMNYLVSLGWDHDDIISINKMAEMIDLSTASHTPSRFDEVKLASLNAKFFAMVKEVTDRNV